MQASLGPNSTANAINNAGQVAGFTNLVGGTTVATVWNGTTPTYLVNPGTINSLATSINDLGQVAEFGYGLSSPNVFVATVWNGLRQRRSAPYPAEYPVE